MCEYNDRKRANRDRDNDGCILIIDCTGGQIDGVICTISGCRYLCCVPRFKTRQREGQFIGDILLFPVGPLFSPACAHVRSNQRSDWLRVHKLTFPWTSNRLLFALMAPLEEILIEILLSWLIQSRLFLKPSVARGGKQRRPSYFKWRHHLVLLYLPDGRVVSN